MQRMLFPWKYRPLLRALGGVLAVSILGISGLAQAQSSDAGNYPSQTVRIMNPFSAGGSLDTLGRIIAQKLTDKWGHAVVVENRPGASTVIGINAVAQAAPDGYTLGLASNTFAMNASRFLNLPYDSRKDLAPVATLTETPFMLVARSDFPAKSVKEFIAAAKNKPGGFNYGSIGEATSPHIAGEMLKQAAGIEMTHVPYKGTAPALQDLLGGSISIMFANVPDVVPHLQSGRLIALATTDSVRSKQFPDVPTMGEAGYPQIDIQSWYVMIAPGKTPKAIIDKVSKDVAEVLAMPDVRDRLEKLELKPVPGSPEDLGRMLDSEFKRYAKLIDDIGLERVK